MIGASFVTLCFWLAVVLLACVCIAAVGEWFEARERRRRIARLRERRLYLDRTEHRGTPYIPRGGRS